MKTTTIILSIAATLLAVFAVVEWLSPAGSHTSVDDGYSYGVSEGLQLVRKADGSLVVLDSDGNTAFPIPLRGCDIDTRFRDGRLRFREKSTNRQGYIDRHGIITFDNGGYPTPQVGESPNPQLPDGSGGSGLSAANPVQGQAAASPNAGYPAQNAGGRSPKQQYASQNTQISNTDLRTIARSNPFYAEAAKILQGRLGESDAQHRHTILNYCEHFRTAYTTKDIDFLRQVFSDNALIIVGNVVKSKSGDNAATGDRRVTYALHTKQDYLSRLTKVFALNKRIDVGFSDFHIMRHPTMDGIYGVTLRQHYKSDRYEDDGYLFLLWDFRNPSMPVIHVRTWQPAKTVSDDDDVIGIGDFNLE